MFVLKVWIYRDYLEIKNLLTFIKGWYQTDDISLLCLMIKEKAEG